MYEALQGIHMLSAIGGFGLTAYGAVRGGLSAAHLRLVSLLLAVVLLLGIALTLDRWDFGQPWISATFAIVLVMGGILGAVLTPAAKRDEPGRMRGGLLGLTLLWIVAAVLMIAKPG